MQNAPCLMCRQKSAGDTELNMLRQLLNRLRGKAEPKEGARLGIIWASHERCRYGLRCDTLERKKREAQRLGEELEPYLAAIAGDPALEGECRHALHCMRGYFPAAYRTLERERAKAMRKAEKAS